MLKFVISLLFICALAQALPAQTSFAFPEDLERDRIISGWPAVLGQFPHQVHLRMVTTTGGLNACGGSIIHPQWILTAAHCLTDKTRVFVRYAAINTTQPGLILESDDFVIHPQYNPNNLNHDVGLVNVARWVQESENIQVVRMPGRDALDVTYTDYNATVSGYGRTVDGGPASEILNFVNLTIVSNEYCAGIYNIIINSTICAVGIENTAQSPCHGDSGGPLVVYDESGWPTLIGVVSFVSGAGCSANFPSGYVRPQFYHDWMTEVTGLHFG